MCVDDGGARGRRAARRNALCESHVAPLLHYMSHEAETEAQYERCVPAAERCVGRRHAPDESPCTADGSLSFLASSHSMK
jgi:hypothetical protein